MITPKETADVLKNRRKKDGVFTVQVKPDGSVLANLENRFDPHRPHTLTVERFVEDRRLLIHISLFDGPRQDNGTSILLANARLTLPGGQLTIDSSKGIAFEVDNFLPGVDSEQSADLLDQWLEAAIRDFRRIETFVVHAQRLARASEDIFSTMP